jgi:hypothetical protein
MTTKDSIFPALIDEWQRSNRETIRVFLDRFQGRAIVHVRVFYFDAAGISRPGRDGLALGIGHLPKLADAICEAYRLACERGLIEPDNDNAAS